MVVSTGGGIIQSSENWGILRQGIVIWIDINTQVALNRLKDQINIRPLLKGKDLKKLYSDIFHARLDLYSQADIKVSVNEESIEQVVDMILSELKKTVV